MESGAIYSDFGGLASLRVDAQQNPNATLKEVAPQFESLFLQMMMKSMREAIVKSDLFQSNQMDAYMSMADNQLAVSLSESGGIGIARMLIEQIHDHGLVADDVSVESEMTTHADTTHAGMRIIKQGAPIGLISADALKEYALPVADKKTMLGEG